MPKFAANLSFLYTDRPLLQRIAAAAKAGFKAVEFMFPYEEPVQAVKKALTDNGLIQALFNAPAGDFANGERGLASVAGRDEEFADAIAKAIEYGTVLECPRVNVMAGIAPKSEARDKSMDRLVERFVYAADAFAKHNMIALLEHINPYDMPGYFVGTPAMALEAITRVNRPNAKIQYDVYHAARTSGELVNFLKDNLAIIEHIQIADNPGRHQPGTGEINYKFVLDQMDKLGYKGWVGLEYKPEPDADGSYGWVKEIGYSL